VSFVAPRRPVYKVHVGDTVLALSFAQPFDIAELHDDWKLGAAGWRCHAQHGSTAIPRGQLRLTWATNERWTFVERRVAGFASVEDPQHVGHEENQ